MKNFESIAKGIKFNGDVDFDKVRTLHVEKEDVKGGSRLVAWVQYDNGTRFESVGEHQEHKAIKKAERLAPVEDDITVVDHSQDGEAVVSTATASPTATAPAGIVKAKR